MITEDYVSFETAKLLKEKGFDEQCTYVYDSQHKLYSTFEQCRQITRNNSDWIHYVGKLNVVPIAVPTLQMAMKWLREVHTIVVVVFPIRTVKGELAYNASIYNTDAEHKKLMNKDYQSYEEACEETIKYCLTNLI